MYIEKWKEAEAKMKTAIGTKLQNTNKDKLLEYVKIFKCDCASSLSNDVTVGLTTMRVRRITKLCLDPI